MISKEEYWPTGTRGAACEDVFSEYHLECQGVNFIDDSEARTSTSFTRVRASPSSKAV